MVRLIASLSYLVTALYIAAKRAKNRHAAKQHEIDENLRLDLIAVKRAESILHQRIRNGEVSSLDNLREQLKTEIKFQKIAVRED